MYNTLCKTLFTYIFSNNKFSNNKYKFEIDQSINDIECKEKDVSEFLKTHFLKINSTNLTLTNDRNNDPIIVFKFRYVLNACTMNNFELIAKIETWRTTVSPLFSRG